MFAPKPVFWGLALLIHFAGQEQAVTHWKLPISNACNYTNWTMQGGLTWKALRQSRLVISSFETRSKDATINCSTIQLQNESSNLQPKFIQTEHFRASSAPSSGTPEEGATEALKQQVSINFGWHFMSFDSVSWANQAVSAECLPLTTLTQLRSKVKTADQI